MLTWLSFLVQSKSEAEEDREVQVWFQDSERVGYDANATAGIKLNIVQSSNNQKCPLVRPTRTYPRR